MGGHGGRRSPFFLCLVGLAACCVRTEGLKWAGAAGTGRGSLGNLGAAVEGVPTPPADWLDPSMLPEGIPAIGAGAINGQASNHFGDIMGDEEDLMGSGRALLKHFAPMERVVLTANGNLQRIIGSYYNARVKVSVDKCDEIAPGVYDRCATLDVSGQHFCTAKSIIMLHSARCVQAVTSQNVPIGQLFRHLDTLPTFCLLNAGVSGGGCLWRVYDLHSQHLSCRIREEFIPNLFDLEVDPL